MKSRTIKLLASFVVSSALFVSSTTQAFALTLQKGSSAPEVKVVQAELKKKNFFKANITGYYGSVTEGAVKSFQKSKKLKVTGIVDDRTYTVLTGKVVPASKSASPSRSTRGYAMPWSQASSVFAKGMVATITDVDTKKTFKLKRTYGHNHADVEPVTAHDAEIIKSIWGGWSWARRAVVVTVNGQDIAASMAAMPHAGLDNKPANEYVYGRSGGYGYGMNLDAVKNNATDGHMDVHFAGSKTHGTNRVDEKHQAMVQKAAATLR